MMLKCFCGCHCCILVVCWSQPSVKKMHSKLDQGWLTLQDAMVDILYLYYLVISTFFMVLPMMLAAEQVKINGCSKSLFESFLSEILVSFHPSLNI